MLFIDLALAGLGVGAVAALAGLGLLLTYRVTGVFNIAFGAIATLAAYLLWQMVRVWHWPQAVSAVLVIGVVCPALGVILDVGLFRSLQRRRSPATASLVATIGVFVLLVGLETYFWGIQARTDAVSLTPSRSVGLPGGASVRMSTLVALAVVLVVGVVITSALRTRFGLLSRAVVDDRNLAMLAVVDVNRISAVAWAAGAVLAGVSGILLAPSLRLDPYTLTLVVLETMAVVVFARLTSAFAVVVSALMIGVVQSELTRLHLTGDPGVVFEALRTNLFVVALFAALLLMRRLDEPGGADSGAVASLAVRGTLATPRGWWLPALLFLGIPLLLSRGDLQTAQRVPAFAIILVSVVVVSGYSGQLSFGQAAYAGFGALLAAKFQHGQVPGIPAVPGLVALAGAVVVTGCLGLLMAWPAIRRRGLFLALTTFSIAALVSRLVFAQPTIVSDLRVGPPAPFDGPVSFYLFEVVCLGAVLLLVRFHHRGRIGRALMAIRDDEEGAHACGVDAHRLRIRVFALGAAVATLGGALLAQSARAFDAGTFDPLQGLIWFAAVVVFGIDSAAGAVLGAALIVGLDQSFGEGLSTIVIGAAAVVMGRTPGGLLFTIRRLGADRSRYFGPRVSALASDKAVTLSPAGRALAARLRR